MDDAPQRPGLYALPLSELSRRDFIKKGTVVAIVTAGFPTILAACGPSATPTQSASGSNPLTSGPRSLSNQVPDPTNAYWALWTAGVNAAASPLRLAAETATTNNTVATQISLMETEATKQIKMVVLTVADTAIVPQVANIASQNGMWWGNAHSHPAWIMVETLGDQYSVFTTPDNFQMTYELGKSMCTAIGGVGKVIHIKGVPGFSASVLRAAGYAKAASEFPGIEIVAEDYGYFNRVQTGPVFERLFSAHPDVKAVMCASDDSAMGVISVLKGRNVTGVLTTGIDAIPEYLAAIESGQYAHATCTIYGTWNGAWLTARVFDAVHGFKPDPLERMMITGHSVIDSPAAATAYSAAFLNGSGVSNYKPELMSRVLHPNDWRPQNLLRIFAPDEQWPNLQSKPSGFSPPQDWTTSFNANNVAKLDALYKSNFDAMNPASSIGVPVTA